MPINPYFADSAARAWALLKLNSGAGRDSGIYAEENRCIAAKSSGVCLTMPGRLAKWAGESHAGFYFHSGAAAVYFDIVLNISVKRVRIGQCPLNS